MSTEEIADVQHDQEVFRVKVTMCGHTGKVRKVFDIERESFKKLCDIPSEYSWDYMNASLRNVFKFLRRDYAVISKESLAEIIPAYWCNVFKNLLKDTWTEVDEDFYDLLHSDNYSWMQYIVDHALANITPPEQLMLVSFMGLSIVTYVTDLGYEQMRQCVSNDLLYSIFKYVFPHLRCFDNKTNNARRLQSLCLFVVYNCARNPANRSSYRSSSFLDGAQFSQSGISLKVKDKVIFPNESVYEILMNIFDVTKQVLTNTKFQEDVDKEYMQNVHILAVLSLAYLFEEGVDAMQFSATDEIIIYLQSSIYSALKSPTFIHLTFSLEELLNGLEKLAVNKDNQERMITHRVLVLLLKVLQRSDLPNLACAAALKVLWQLSFNHASKIKETLLDVICDLKEHNNDNIRENAEGVMWELEDRAEKKISTSGPQKHIMLSYCWAQQDVVKKIALLLKESGFNLWLDIDKMTGSTIDAMAEAVENATIVLMFVSRNYKESAACQSEAKYASYRGVLIIPIMLENNWKPDGWLGLIICTLLYFKFPEDNELAFSSKYHELHTEIIRRCKEKGIAIPGAKNVATSSVNAMHVNNWTKGPKGSSLELQNCVRKTYVDEHVEPSIENLVQGGNEDYFKELDSLCPTSQKTPSGNANMWNKQEICDWLEQNKIDRNKFSSNLTLDGELLKFLYELRLQHPVQFYKFLENDLQLKSLEDVSRFVIGLGKLQFD
ncbi:uncharacterized protein LOC130630553 isoform X2 [Hydractinia symbiolongicarpus]|uniref:uncharacterized protein LOC130630553 isoform X2 n=1 Tax=Hydractinia symbiolongicarpus TaxID=13093 RepID=UPI00254BD1FE|nr:uncharacterized protein LOC130630553 isoform X2 [Hydractinia symbiolongicarpus]